MNLGPRRHRQLASWLRWSTGGAGSCGIATRGWTADPVFCRLLAEPPAGEDEIGLCDVVLDGYASATQAYDGNTASWSRLEHRSRRRSRIVDFVPRFKRHGRRSGRPR